LLDDRERRVFRRLAVFADGFQRGAAAAVCSDDDLPPEMVHAAIDGLVDKSLISFASEEDRYRLLELARQYALERLREADEEERVTERCARYLMRLVSDEIDLYSGPRTVPSALRVRREFRNIAATLPWLIQNDSGASLTLLFPFAQSHWALVPVHISAL